ncbi:AhpC/TSA family protein [Pedobacter frigoris]|uniref:AhpC/TSA family protein n=1 Tax=Pedobacter frigoris TaxID=2571272 RepID=A0A4U1CCD2_9SPHI|nr:AhpC/TSA family protein [Pedobacter frigoris]TKC04395.1 AhpC/TSA family protein [Pedobacter frigoris]
MMMNKLKNSLMAVTLVAVAGCAQNKSSDGYAISGKIKGVDSGMVRLMHYNEADRTSKAVDSALLKDGVFELKGKIDNPEVMGLQFSSGNWGMRLFVENSKITVDIDTTGAEHYDYTAYGMGKGASLKTFKISGSKVNDEYEQYENNPEQLKFKAAYAALDKMKGADHEALRAKSDSISKLYKAWQLKYINDFVAKDPASVAGVYMFSNYYMFESSMPISKVEAMLAKFQSGAKGSAYYDNLSENIEMRKRVLPGKSAPDFTLLTRDSTSFSLSSTKGKYVMVDFWASWCKPCREAIPHWKEVYQKYKDKGFEIVSVSNDSKWKDWFKAMDQEQMPWIQVCDEFPLKNMPAKVSTLYQTPSLPCYVLLDKEGKILVHTIEEKDIDRKLAEVFR